MQAHWLYSSMDPSSSLPPVHGDQNRISSILAAFWTEWAVACVVVSLRLWARLMIKKLGIDDWMMFFTLVRSLSYGQDVLDLDQCR